MISKKDIVGMVHHIVRRGGGYADRKQIHPMREWMTGLVGGVLLFCLLSGYAGYTFYTLLQGENEAVFFESPLVTYDQRSVQSVLDQYAKRQEAFDELRANPVVLEPVIAPLETEGNEEEISDDTPLANE
jgi:hypothetical protein